ncbi:hypothetical protein [Thalassomonas sp. RHCl1]|uniref:hypothetical protein n=1 Tax=Thalassomonas sp. RHCl1 TaxID=2995320 RepID=UPI00248B8CB0|nr:hypothetical protein [Thalassomonas sp. RHCl1]
MNQTNEEVTGEGTENSLLSPLSQPQMDAVYAYGMQLFSAGSYKKAEELFAGLCLFDIAQPRYWQAKGDCRSKQGDYHGAYRCFSAASTIAPKEPKHLLSAALCQIRLSKPSLAKTCLEQVLAMNPDDLLTTKKAQALLQQCQ